MLAAVAFVRIPQAAPEQPLPERAQVTPLFAGSFVTVALNFCCEPTVTFEVAGDTLTDTPAITVIVAEAVLLVSAAEVAVSVTVAGEGTEPGAA